MKYYTKEWYKLNQQTNIDLGLTACKGANVFSEVLFQKLYCTKLREFIELWKEISPEEFEERAFIQKFEEAFKYNKNYLKENLPLYILDQVADMRVLTLKRATKEIIEEIHNFCEKNRKEAEQARQDYIDYLERDKEILDIEIINNINFHDCTITEFKQEEENICLTFDNKGGFTNLTEAKFVDTIIKEQDISLEQCWWIYSELYKIEDKYELHVLVQNQSMELGYFTFKFRHAYFK